MAVLSERLELPLTNYIGPRSPGTIKTIAPGVFANVEAKFVTAIPGMLVSYENSLVFCEGGAVIV